ncbi:MAG: histidine kinase dimerization/phospho-acceptor domain-containing protein [Planctomycetota bacterium]
MSGAGAERATGDAPARARTRPPTCWPGSSGSARPRAGSSWPTASSRRRRAASTASSPRPTAASPAPSPSARRSWPRCPRRVPHAGRRVRADQPEARRLVARFGAGPVAALLEGPGGTESLVDPDGRARRLQVTATDLPGGVRLGFVEDRTEIDALSEELGRLARLSSLSELALGVAHEVRNPLTAIAGFAGMLRRDPDAPKARRWAEAIEEGAQRVERIIRDLLVFARPEDREPVVERRLGAWIAEAHEDAEALAVELEGGAVGARVRGAPEALGKVFANLLRNAAEAGAGRVVVTAEACEPDRLRLRFADDGPASPGLRDRLFDPFAGGRLGGTGLGLAFCARALEAMDGRIRLEDRAGGACFVVELPGRVDA